MATPTSAPRPAGGPTPLPTSPFRQNVETLLESTESLIRLQHSTLIDATALKDLLRLLASKVESQEEMIIRQRIAIEELTTEVQRLKSRDEEFEHVRKSVTSLENTSESLVAQQQVQSQDNIRFARDLEAAKLDLLRLGRPLTASAATAAPPSAIATLPHNERSDIVMFNPEVNKTTPIGAPAPTSSSPSDHPRVMAGMELTESIQGMRVTAVKPGGPAQLGGITVGEVVLRVNGKDIRSKASFLAAIDGCVPGQGVDVVHRKDANPVKTTRIFLAPAAVPKKHFSFVT